MRHIQENNVRNFVDCTHASLQNRITLKYDQLAFQGIQVGFRDITVDSNVDCLLESLPNHVLCIITGSGVTNQAQNNRFEQEEDIAAGDDGAFFMMEFELYQVQTVQMNVVTAVGVDF